MRRPHFTRLSRLGMLLFCGLLCAAWGVAVTAYGQDDNGGRDSGLRTVYGEVTDKGDKPLNDAVIYLKNVRTLTVRTYISNKLGEYRFAGLDPNVDYEIHAETADLTSSNRTISSFNSRKEIHVALKVDKDKKHG